MNNLILPKKYDSKLSLMETEIAIKKIKDFFQINLAKELNLIRVSAPLFVDPLTGLNDNLNGVERTVGFTVKDLEEQPVEIVQSLAKWKRMALGKYGVEPGTGLYTDMNAIRRDEELDNLHSIYVDQWDWEKVIDKKDRTKEYLVQTVQGIYSVMIALRNFIKSEYPYISVELPDELYFVDAQELEDKYPELEAKEREDVITKEKGAVFIHKIGGKMNSGQRHDGRAPDYDDWELNGDILVWNSILDRAFELSSMGIRVDEVALEKQLEEANAQERKTLQYHKDILDKNLPYTIGGGIGQSRLCMFFLKKAHIGEVQVSVWGQEMIDLCKENGINLL